MPASHRESDRHFARALHQQILEDFISAIEGKDARVIAASLVITGSHLVLIFGHNHTRREIQCVSITGGLPSRLQPLDKVRGRALIIAVNHTAEPRLISTRQTTENMPRQIVWFLLFVCFFVFFLSRKLLAEQFSLMGLFSSQL